PPCAPRLSRPAEPPSSLPCVPPLRAGPAGHSGSTPGSPVRPPIPTIPGSGQEMWQFFASPDSEKESLFPSNHYDVVDLLRASEKKQGDRGAACGGASVRAGCVCEPAGLSRRGREKESLRDGAAGSLLIPSRDVFLRLLE